jgi:hypothetical protein
VPAPAPAPATPETYAAAAQPDVSSPKTVTKTAPEKTPKKAIDFGDAQGVARPLEQTTAEPKSSLRGARQELQAIEVDASAAIPQEVSDALAPGMQQALEADAKDVADVADDTLPDSQEGPDTNTHEAPEPVSQTDDKVIPDVEFGELPGDTGQTGGVDPNDLDEQMKEARRKKADEYFSRDETPAADDSEFDGFKAPLPYEGVEGDVVINDTSGAGVYTSQNILNNIQFPTEAAQKQVEAKHRRTKDINRLKDEIRSFHLIYDADIPMFTEKQHKQNKKAALESNDIRKVAAHHKIMQDAIRNYYRTSELKVGVIMSAERVFGQSVNSIPNSLQSLAQAIDPTAQPNARFIKKGEHEFSRAVAGETRINRLGRNYKKPVYRNVPKTETPAPNSTQLDEPVIIPDVQHPIRRIPFQIRRQRTQIPKIVLKTK